MAYNASACIMIGFVPRNRISLSLCPFPEREKEREREREREPDNLFKITFLIMANNESS